MVTIATWNVNSIKARLPNVLDWLKQAKPDIVLLQEIKTTEDQFPGLELGDLGYNVAVAGQKTYNGVAILSKSPIEVEHRRLPGDKSDDQARYLEAFTGGVRVASVYAPNGNPALEDGKPSDKFRYKLAWFDRLRAHVTDMLKTEDAFVLGGDFNVIPEPEDVYDPDSWEDDALYHIEARRALRRIMHLGLTDAFRAVNGEAHRYTWWDYRAGAWAKDQGARIDHLLLSPQAADRLDTCVIDRKPRGQDKASDHTPVVCTLRNKS